MSASIDTYTITGHSRPTRASSANLEAVSDAVSTTIAPIAEAIGNVGCGAAGGAREGRTDSSVARAAGTGG
jgi:hypothetical protein